MTLRSIQYRILDSNFCRRVSKETRKVEQKLLNILPNKTFNSPGVENTISYIGKEISSAETRLINGVTALMSQPFIDSKNKDVDEKTRKFSVARTVAKIVAGTLTGYAVRKGSISLIRSSKLKSLFTPSKAKVVKGDAYEHYQDAMGTVVALVAMLFTNFAIDAPLTRFLTNKFAGKDGGKNETSK